MSVKASCSRCAFSRRFSEDLGGRFYRCPKCKKGVIAVPVVDPESSDIVPMRLSSSSFENPFKAVARKHRGSGGGEETLETTAVGSTAEESALAPGVSETEVGGVAAEESADAEASAAGGDEPTDHRGEVATARRILVECGLCGFLVRIPAEFFGKTVHCPECAGNTIFSESTLDPVKDELLDRLILETGERRLLFPPPEAGGSRLAVLRAYLSTHAARSFLVGVGLGVLVLLGLWAVAQSHRASVRDEVVEEAGRQGWRYATVRGGNTREVHEPWCRELQPGIGERLTADDFEAREDELILHACR
jgi:hypothetical protein